MDKKDNDDEVVKKTDIATSISSTSTNDKVAGAKAVHDSLANKLDKTVILTTADEVNSFDREYQSFIIEPSVAEAVGLPKAPDSTWFCINLSHVKDFKYPSQIAFEYAGIERIMYRTAHNGVWHNWRKLCTTSVADGQVLLWGGEVTSEATVTFNEPISNYPNAKRLILVLWHSAYNETVFLEIPKFLWSRNTNLGVSSKVRDNEVTINIIPSVDLTDTTIKISISNSLFTFKQVYLEE